MRITRTHLVYWQSRKCVPRWAHSVAAKAPSIDDVVNENGGARRPTDGELAIHNLLSILRLIRRHPGISMLDELNRLSLCPGTVINPEKRASNARKWARRLTRTLRCA